MGGYGATYSFRWPLPLIASDPGAALRTSRPSEFSAAIDEATGKLLDRLAVPDPAGNALRRDVLLGATKEA